MPSIDDEPALFLADSDEEDEAINAPPALDIDINAMFADVDDDDDAFAITQSGPALDTDALQREAEARHRAALPNLTPRQVLPSSSPPRDLGDDSAKPKADGKKEKKRPMRLDETRLLGPTGFPQLIKETKHFCAKGKGHEAADLNRLLRVYQFWTHSMYPKSQFRDTVERVEKLCHSRRMNVALSVWRDEAHGVKGPDDDNIDLTERPTPTSDSAEPASSSSRAPSHPPSSGTEPDDDDFDIDAVIRDEEEKRAARERKKEVGAAGKGREVMDDDEAMWGALDALESAPPPPPAANTGDIDGDEEMWDVLREVEDGAALRADKEPTTPALAEQTTTAITLAPPPDLNPEDNWEDMYL